MDAARAFVVLGVERKGRKIAAGGSSDRLIRYFVPDLFFKKAHKFKHHEFSTIVVYDVMGFCP